MVRKVTPKEFEAADLKRVKEPIILKLERRKRLVTFQPVDFGLLALPEYQRNPNRKLVNDLAYVLRHGGIIPYPIWVAERKDGSYVIVDGQQRFRAHSVVGVPIEAFVYPVDDEADERQLFLIANRQTSLRSHFVINASIGPTAHLIRRVGQVPTSPYFKQLNLGKNGRALFDSSIVARAVCIAVCGGTGEQGSMQDLLDRVDAEFARRPEYAKERAHACLRLLGEVFGERKRNGRKERMRYVHGIALARVAGQRWASRVLYPSKAVITKLKRMNWDAVTQSSASKYIDMVEAAIKRRWLETDRGDRSTTRIDKIIGRIKS